MQEIDQELSWCQKVYGENFYFELQRHQMSDEHIQSEGIDKESWLYQYYLDRVKNQEKVNQTLIALSKEKNIPGVYIGNLAALGGKMPDGSTSTKSPLAIRFVNFQIIRDSNAFVQELFSNTWLKSVVENCRNRK